MKSYNLKFKFILLPIFFAAVFILPKISLAVTGLDFPGNGSGTVRFKFTNPHLNGLPIYGPSGQGVTYIWRAYPRQQSNYYTTFFWGNDDGQGNFCTFLWKTVDGNPCWTSDTYYGAHPWPIWPSMNTHKWEIAVEGTDFANDWVTYDRWYTQALRVWEDASGYKHHEFYWDLPNTDAGHIVSRTSPTSWGEVNPPSPALTWGDAPWQPGLEVYDGILRGIQIYNTNLSLADIQNEINNPLSTSAGVSNIWYLNTNPTPTDISDKSGKGHNPAWVGSNRPTLYTEGGSSDTTAPAVSITFPTSGSTVSGSSVTVSANASDNVGVVGVQFKLDGANLGSEDTSSPYSITWNTTQTTNGSHALTATARDAAGNQTTSSGVTVTVNNVVTPPPPSGGGLAMPSLQDEKNTYIKWGWSWTVDKEPGAVTEPIVNYSVSDPDIHGDTEGDDLWTYINMYRRTSNSVYLNRANAWARYFKNDYRNCVGGAYSDFCYDKDAFGADHMYGYGLIALYEYNGDTAALAEAENLGAVLEGLYSPGTTFGCLPNNACTHYGLRQSGRHLILASRLAEVTGKARWVQLRDKIINLLLNSGEWDATYGMYFYGDWQTDYAVGSGSYASGVRIMSPFELGVFAEAFWQTWRTTGNQEIKNRLTKMARFVDQYGMDPATQYAGYRFGVKNGQPYHNGVGDPVYSTDLVNVLVIGYKLTGDQNLLNRAKYFFNRGTKGEYGTGARLASDTEVHHFIDTKFFYSYLDYNKGELLYTYLIFENGGNPTVVGVGTDTTPPSAPSGVTVN